MLLLITFFPSTSTHKSTCITKPTTTYKLSTYSTSRTSKDMAKHEIDEDLLRKFFEVIEAVKKLPSTTTRQKSLREINEDVSRRLRSVFMDKGLTCHGVMMELRARHEFEEKVQKAQAKKRLTLLKGKVDVMLASADLYTARSLEVALKEIGQIAGKKRKARVMMSEERE